MLYMFSLALVDCRVAAIDHTPPNPNFGVPTSECQVPNPGQSHDGQKIFIFLSNKPAGPARP